MPKGKLLKESVIYKFSSKLSAPRSFTVSMIWWILTGSLFLSNLTFTEWHGMNFASIFNCLHL